MGVIGSPPSGRRKAARPRAGTRSFRCRLITRAKYLGRANLACSLQKQSGQAANRKDGRRYHDEENQTVKPVHALSLAVLNVRNVTWASTLPRVGVEP